MPTYDQEERFRHEYHRLRRAEQRLFKQAVKEFVTALKEHRPPPQKLGIQRYERESGVYEFHWAPDGRALFRYGTSPHPEDIHIIWLRIGGHDIY